MNCDKALFLIILKTTVFGYTRPYIAKGSANKGIDTRMIPQYLGHCNIQHNVRYTALNPHRFTQFWDD
jgi:hypothetical protein